MIPTGRFVDAWPNELPNERRPETGHRRAVLYPTGTNEQSQTNVFFLVCVCEKRRKKTSNLQKLEKVERSRAAILWPSRRRCVWAWLCGGRLWHFRVRCRNFPTSNKTPQKINGRSKCKNRSEITNLLHLGTIVAVNSETSFVVRILHHLAEDQVKRERMDQRTLWRREQLSERKFHRLIKIQNIITLYANYLFAHVQRPRHVVVSEVGGVERSVQLGVNTFQSSSSQFFVDGSLARLVIIRKRCQRTRFQSSWQWSTVRLARKSSNYLFMFQDD